MQMNKDDIILNGGRQMHKLTCCMIAICEVQSQVKLIYGVRSQDSGLPLDV